MYKTSKLIKTALILSLFFAVISCDYLIKEEPDNPDNPNNPTDSVPNNPTDSIVGTPTDSIPETPTDSIPETPTDSIPPEEAMSPIAQKIYLETVGIEFLEYFNQNKFAELTDLLSYSHSTYSNYSWDNVSSWANDIFNGLIENIGMTFETDSYGNTNHYNNQKILILASNFNSRFVAEGNTWIRHESNNLQFEFKDQNNNDCILKFYTNGNIKKVHVANFDDWYDEDYNPANGTYSTYYDRTQLTIGVPEQIYLVLTCGGKTMLKETLNIDLASITNEKFDFSKSNLNLNTIVEIYNGYKFELTKASYTPNNIFANIKMSSRGKKLIDITASSDITDIPSLNLDELSSEYFDEDDYDFSTISANNVYAKIDILGKIQVQGVISKANKFIEYIYGAESNNTDESKFKSYLNQANALTKLYLFYNGTNTIHASIKLEPFYDSYDDWYYEPVFVFYDGSSYCSLEAFFYDADFKKLIDRFEQILEDYSNKFDF